MANAKPAKPAARATAGAAAPWPAARLTGKQPVAQQIRPTAGPTPRPGALTVQVLTVSKPAVNAVTLQLVLPGKSNAPAPYLPGQFITLSFGMGGETLYRSYSLCGDGRTDRPWEITIKRQPGGRISNFLNDAARPGMMLGASAPQGNFTLPTRPSELILVAGGSGITPIYGMLRTLAARPAANRPHVTLHYGYHSPADAIFARELVALDPKGIWLTQYHYIGTSGQRIQPQHIAMSAGSNSALAHWYVCGPDALRAAVVSAAARAGAPERNTHVESFANAASRGPIGKNVVARIHLADNGKVLDARSGETLLETLERYGYKPDFSCRAGACGTCALRKLSGRTRGDEQGSLTPHERQSGYVLACSAMPQGDVTLASAINKGGSRVAARKRNASGRNILRVALVAGVATVFFNVWGLTNHAVSASSSSNSSNSSNSSSSSSNSSSSNSSSSSSSSSSSNTGNSGFSNGPTFGNSNGSTGNS